MLRASLFHHSLVRSVLATTCTFAAVIGVVGLTNLGESHASPSLTAARTVTTAPAQRWDGDTFGWDASEGSQRLVIIGDSLVTQSRPMIKALSDARQTVAQWSINGSAPCSFLDAYRDKMAGIRPNSVELSFAGNASNECMTKALGYKVPGIASPTQMKQVLAQYRKDLKTIIAWNNAQHVRTYLALPPVMAPATYHGQFNAGLVATLKHLASENPGVVRINSGPRELLTPGGKYRQFVVVDGNRQALRYAKDGVHLAAPFGTSVNAQGLIWPVLLDR